MNIQSEIDFWCVPSGTGGTIAGMITALYPQQKAIGFFGFERRFFTCGS